MFQYVGNILCIESKALYDKVNIMTTSNYKLLLHRKKMNLIQRGGNGRVALVEYDSIPEKFKAKIQEAIGGDPHKINQKNALLDLIQDDHEAKAFYSNYIKANGQSLSQSSQEKYYADAIIFNAVTEFIKKRSKVAGVSKANSGVLWKNITAAIQNLDKTKYPHSIKSNYRRVKAKYTKYVDHSYQSLIHGAEGNRNPEKITGEILDWWIAIHSLPVKLSIPEEMSRYEREAKKRGWPKLTLAAVHRRLFEPEVERKWFLGRHGKDEYMNKFGHHLTRKKDNWFPNAYWVIDGTKLDWVHYFDNAQKMAAKLKIDVVIDVYSEKIIGYSFSETEDHTDHFTAVKMAANTAGSHPYLFTYDAQSGHKSKVMQELYGKVVAKHGGTHYHSRPRSKSNPIEQMFSRLQRQVLNIMWFSDKQSVKAKSLDSQMNLDFIQEHKHKLKSKEDLLQAFKAMVNIWNSAKHPRFECSRNKAYNHEQPMREEISFLDQVEMFWLTKRSSVTYKRGGIEIRLKGNSFWYEVLDSDNRIDIDFRRKYVGNKFIVKYDPEHLNEFIRLYMPDGNGGLDFIANAQPKREHEPVPALMSEGDKEAWQQDYLIREIEMEMDEAEMMAARKRAGINPETLIEEQELLIKMGGELPKKERSELESSFINGL